MNGRGGGEAFRTSTKTSVHSVFFFQAEDGIRDVAVTGVQTCALPISNEHCPRPVHDNADRVAFRTGCGWVSGNYRAHDDVCFVDTTDGSGHGDERASRKDRKSVV